MRAKDKKKLSLLNGIGAVLNWLFNALCLLELALLPASAFSDLVSPQKSVIFAYLGLGFPLFLALSLAILFISLFRRKWFLVIITVLVFIVCWKPIKRYCPLHAETEIPVGDDVIKVLSYNVMSFGYQDNKLQSTNGIIRYIVDSKADIICLQEYMVSERNNLMSSNELKAALKGYYVSEEFITTNSNYKYGLAVLSKYPISKEKRIPFTTAYNGSMLCTVNVRGRIVTVINNHLESFKLTAEDRTKYSELFKFSGLEEFDKVSKSLQQKLGHAFPIRAGQADVICREIRQTKGDIIVCGDFNDTPVSYAHHKFRETLTDAFSESGFGFGVSYNRNFFPFRIDHILHSAGMKSYNCRVDRSVRLSDHYPVWCYLKFEN